MPWQLRPDELERWKSAPLPYALHAARYWQDDRSLERIFAIARQTAELEEGLHGLLKRLITSSSDQAQMLQMVPEAIDLLYRFHLVWRVPNSLIRDAMDAVWPALEGLEQRAPKELMLSFARQKWLPMAPAHLEHASWAMLLLEGILPARRMRGSLSNACRELLTLNDEQPLNALIGRIQVVAAHPRLRGSPSRLIDALPSHVFALETLAPLLRALSSIDHPRARTWCEQQYTTVGNLIAGLAPPLSLLEWHLRFQLLDGILRLGWGLESAVATPTTMCPYRCEAGSPTGRNAEQQARPSDRRSCQKTSDRRHRIEPFPTSCILIIPVKSEPHRTQLYRSRLDFHDPGPVLR